MAACLARSHFEQCQVTDVTPASAGLLPGGQPATAEAVAVLKEWGLELDHHRSRQLTPDLLAQADLVLAMTSQHVMEVVALDASAWPRTFTLVDAVRRAERPGCPDRRSDPAGWMAWLHAGRKAESLLKARRDDDIADPYGHSTRVYEQTRDRLDDLVSRLATCLAC